MNLVGGYASSDDDEQLPPPPQQQPQQQSEGGLKQNGKARAVGSVVTPATIKATGNKGKKRRSGKKTTGLKKKNKKTVNALVLSPEIQAALARGDSLGDSDSDDEDGVAKKPKIVRRPAGSDPSDLLSLLPQPSTAASADDILLKSQKKRDDARTAKSAAAAAAAATATRPATAGGGGGIEGQAEEDQESESDEDGDDLLAGMHAKSAAAAAAAASETGSRSGPLFTLPSRARPPPAAAPADPPEQGMEEVVRPSGEGTAAVPGYLETGTPGLSAGQQQWGGFDRGHAAASPQGGYAGAGGYGGAAGAVGGVAAAGTSATDYAVYGAASQQQQQQQQQQTQYYHPYAAGAAAGSYQPEFGGGGAKATRRKGRDMERALARGDLGALGSEMPVMDLQQGSNEYNPLRTKPTTAAMNQEQKHIESSVYDPSTGKTVKTLEPTSMQKRKHQINQLAAQAASMERDLMERSGASRLTKAQTHAKYGW